jgi:hypothetical protein
VKLTDKIRKIAEEIALEMCYKKNRQNIYNESLLTPIGDISACDDSFKITIKDMQDGVLYTENVTFDEIERKIKGVVLLHDNNSGITFEVPEKILKKFKKMMKLMDGIDSDIRKFNKESNSKLTVMVLDDGMSISTDVINRYYNEGNYSGVNYSSIYDEDGESIGENFSCLGCGGR